MSAIVLAQKQEKKKKKEKRKKSSIAIRNIRAQNHKIFPPFYTHWSPFPISPQRFQKEREWEKEKKVPLSLRFEERNTLTLALTKPE